HPRPCATSRAVFVHRRRRVASAFACATRDRDLCELVLQLPAREMERVLDRPANQRASSNAGKRRRIFPQTWRALDTDREATLIRHCFARLLRRGGHGVPPLQIFRVRRLHRRVTHAPRRRQRRIAAAGVPELSRTMASTRNQDRSSPFQTLPTSLPSPAAFLR